MRKYCKWLFILGILVFVGYFTWKQIKKDETLDFSMERLLRTSILPVGQTMYVWGGGWNQADAGANTSAVTIGVSDRWIQYARMQTAEYDYTQTRYQSYDGLDCSGYIGWLVYNVFHTKNGEKGYVMGASRMAQNFADRGWGYLAEGAKDAYQPGDICSMEGHVWMCLGSCSDGSVLLVHASPPGVRICGTYCLDGTESQAVALARRVMKEYYPEWYERYPECGVGYFYLTDSMKMHWYTDEKSDSMHLQEMNAEAIIHFLYDR